MAHDLVLEQLKSLSELKVSDVKKIKADTVKNRTALIQAVERRRLDEVTNLLSTVGCSPNFLLARQGTFHSPLSLAVQNKWEQGIHVLIKYGAIQSSALAQADLPIKDEQGLPASVRNPAADAVGSGLISIALEILDAEKELNDERSSQIIQYATDCAAKRSASAYKEFIAGGYENDTSWKLSQTAILERGSSDDLAWMLKLKGSQIAQSVKLSQKAWMRAIELDIPFLAQALAKAQVGLNSTGWRLNIPADDFRIYQGKAPSRMFKSSTNYSWVNFKKIEGQPPLEAPLVLFAAWRGATKMVSALSQIQPLNEDTFKAPESKELASLVESPDALKALFAHCNANSDDFVDRNGNNPLHKLLGASTSKSAAEKMARVCLDWIGMCNTEGEDPIARCRGSSNHQELSALLESMAIKNGTGGRFKPTKKGHSRSL